VRSTGGGWASFMAKFAAVLAPIIASQVFLGSKQAVLNGYSFVGLCLAGVVVGIVALSVFARRLHAAPAEVDVELMADPEPGVA
jgi:AAHS family 4-hydroxybenzoate transporter-like MFS transporter